MPRTNSTSTPQANSVSIGNAARKRLAGAIIEIITNETTPTGLYNPVGDFLMEATKDLFDEMRKDPIFVERALERTTAR